MIHSASLRADCGGDVSCAIPSWSLESGPLPPSRCGYAPTPSTRACVAGPSTLCWWTRKRVGSASEAAEMRSPSGARPLNQRNHRSDDEGPLARIAAVCAQSGRRVKPPSIPVAARCSPCGSSAPEWSLAIGVLLVALSQSTRFSIWCSHLVGVRESPCWCWTARRLGDGRHRQRSLVGDGSQPERRSSRAVL
jgi:hypothetical protein